MVDKQADAAKTLAQGGLKTQAFTFEDQLEIERKGLWHQPDVWRMEAPFPLRADALSQCCRPAGEFRATIQAERTNQRLYANEINFEIILYVERTRPPILTTMRRQPPTASKVTTASLYSRSRSTGSTDIGKPSFTIVARGSPNDFVLKPQEFYEMVRALDR